MLYFFKRKFFKWLWRKHNKNNFTSAENIFNKELVKVGDYTYGGLNVFTFDNKHELIIGRFCSIAPQVVFMLSGEHCTKHISSYPFKVKILGRPLEGESKGNISVDDDVWIGYGAIIMSGVHIGQGAVIAAGSVVTRDIPPYAVVCGVPARIIKYRFDKSLISELTDIDYGKLTEEMVALHEKELYEELTATEQLDWLPRLDKTE